MPIIHTLEYLPLKPLKRKEKTFYRIEESTDFSDGVELLLFRKTLVESLGYNIEDIHKFSFAVLNNKGKEIGRYVWR